IFTVVPLVYLLFYLLTFGAWRERGTPVYLTLHAMSAAPFLWWAASSTVAFLLMLPFWMARAIAAAVPAGRAWDAPEPVAPARREFLGRTAAVVAGAPFVAGAYGLLHGRLNLETTSPRIVLPKLPRAFEGFRICQLSDLHIGPYMPAEEIRKY